MEIVPFEKIQKGDWNKFCKKSDDTWFWHLSEWIEYTLNYSPESRAENFSFALVNNGQIEAICPLVLETNDGIREFAYGRNYTPMPALKNGLSSENRITLFKEIFEHIDNVALDKKIDRSKFRFSVINPGFLEKNLEKYNVPLRFGYIDNSIQTQILDLSLPVEELKSNLRHGHRSDIVRAEKEVEIKIFDSQNFSPEVFEMYVKAKTGDGKSKRPKTTFDIMKTHLEEGEGFMAIAYYKGVAVSFSYFFIYKNNSYYGSAVTLNDAPDLPIAHLLQWKSILYMKGRGIKFYEIGWQVFGDNFSDFSSAKEVNISKFKRGFGGTTYPLYMSEKYYNKSLFLKVWEGRVKKVYKNLK